MTVKTVGLDLAKDVFQVHGISENGRIIFNKAIKRAKLLSFFETLPPCTVGMEACGSSHHWGRQLRKLGHDVTRRSGGPTQAAHSEMFSGHLAEIVFASVPHPQEPRVSSVRGPIQLFFLLLDIRVHDFKS